jgi:hypothetical protein
MSYSSTNPAPSRKADRSVGAGARRSAVATITPAPSVAGERVACRGVKDGDPQRIGRTGLAKLLGGMLIAGLGRCCRAGASVWVAAILEFSRTAAGLGDNGGQALAFAPTAA